MELPDSEDRPKLNDPFAKLEHGNEDARRGRDARNRLTELYSDSAAKFQDDYATNKALRRAMRYVPHQLFEWGFSALVLLSTTQARLDLLYAGNFHI